MSKRRAAESIENSLTKVLKRDNVNKARQYLNGLILLPYDELIAELKRQKNPTNGGGDHVMHWFRSDLRINDNRALSAASEFAQSVGKPLITLYIISPKEFESHHLSNVKIDLIIRNLLQLQKELDKLKIPLIIDSISNRNYQKKLNEICDVYHVKRVFANYEYEMDELQRDRQIVKDLKNERYFEFYHDQCIVDPNLIKSKTGTAFKVFKAWYIEWCRMIYHQDDKFLKLSPAPRKNQVLPNTITQENNVTIFDHQKLDSEMLARMKSMYLDNEEKIHSKLISFIKNDLKDYESLKDFPCMNKSSVISPYTNIGAISTRTIVSEVLKKFEGNKSSSVAFIREVAWRDFYRHKIVEFPHVIMGLPFNLKTLGMTWENDAVKFKLWCEGKTGFALVDLSMRKLNKDGYMNNRCRMVCANFLVKNLLIDWRYGEQYFMTRLIDGDFCSNNGGWGFVSSTGVNCQPFFRVFNPELQQRNFDKDLKFVKTWIPEYDEDGYVDPIVDYKTTKEMFINNYKSTIQ